MLIQQWKEGQKQDKIEEHHILQGYFGSIVRCSGEKNRREPAKGKSSDQKTGSAAVNK